MKAIKIGLIFIYIFLSIVCCAGAINFGYDNSEGLYIVAGVLCLATSFWNAYKVYKEGGNG